MEVEQTGKFISEIEPNYIRANTVKRMLNYLIDVFGFSFFVFLLTFVVGILFPNIFELLTDENIESLLFKIVFIITHAIYMSLIEGIFKGKTIGKVITKTRALNMDMTNISLKTAFARGFIRVLPFSLLSAFGSPCDPWHDRWTNTIVIDEKLAK